MYKIDFECDVNGISSVKRYTETIYVEADTPKAARDKAESYIKDSYSDAFAVLSVEPLYIVH